MARAASQLEETRSMQLMLSTALSQCASEFRALLQTIVWANQAIFGAVVHLHRLFAKGTPQQLSYGRLVTFQDACGDFFPIHLQWTSCWSVRSKNPDRHRCMLADSFRRFTMCFGINTKASQAFQQCWLKTSSCRMRLRPANGRK